MAYEKLGLVVDQNWLERDLSALLLRALAVGRRQQSESIEVLLSTWIKKVLWMVLTLIGTISCKVSPNLSSCNPSIARMFLESHLCLW